MHGIGGVILAAGGSTRLGQPKQLVQLGGETLVHAAARAAFEGGCGVVCVVTGHAREAVESAVADLGADFVHNPDWSRGMGSSARLGVQALREASAIVLLACDQPAVDGKVVRGLLERFRETGKPIVASRYAETLGVPALFDCSCFAEMRQLPDQCGAKVIIQSDPARVAHFDFPEGAWDLDSPDDLQAWRCRLEHLPSLSSGTRR